MNIENNNRYRRPRMTLTDMILLLAVAGLILAFAIIYETATSFQARVNEIHTWQASMEAECIEIQADQAEMWAVMPETEATETTETAPTPQASITGETEIYTIIYDPELARIVALESDGSYEGALGVATVIYNRLASGIWGNTIHKVISAENQFSVYDSQRIPIITDTIMQACVDAANGKGTLPADVLYFCTPAAYQRSEFFQGLKIYAEYAGTVWCREG